MQQHRRAYAYRRPRHRGDDGFLRLADGVQKLEHRLVVVARGIIEKVLQVVTGGEQVGLAVDQQHAHLVVGLRRLDCIGHGLIHGRSKRVFLVRTIDLDAQYAVTAFRNDVFHVFPGKELIAENAEGAEQNRIFLGIGWSFLRVLCGEILRQAVGSLCPLKSSRSLVFRSLPVAVCGNCSTNTTSSGIHHFAILPS